MKNKHDTVYLNYQNTKVPIDKKIAPLLKEIWKCGARTTSSCEDIGDSNSEPDTLGVCMLQFENTKDAICFLNAATVFHKGGKSLFNRMSHCGCFGVIPWKYDIIPYDRAYEWTRKKEFYNGPADYGFLVTIYFPKSDIAPIMKKLRAR